MDPLGVTVRQAWLGCIVMAMGCAGSPDGLPDSGTSPPSGSPEPVADVVSVSVTGTPGAYVFSVTVRSDDLGCDQYADWWEVRRKSGDLVYRRILNHSHVDEQPFTRDGGPVDLLPSDEVWVLAHLEPSGFGGKWMAGTVQTGFMEEVDAPYDTAKSWAGGPLPEDCMF